MDMVFETISIFFSYKNGKYNLLNTEQKMIKLIQLIFFYNYNIFLNILKSISYEL